MCDRNYPDYDPSSKILVTFERDQILDAIQIRNS